MKKKLPPLMAVKNARMGPDQETTLTQPVQTAQPELKPHSYCQAGYCVYCGGTPMENLVLDEPNECSKSPVNTRAEAPQARKPKLTLEELEDRLVSLTNSRGYRVMASTDAICLAELLVKWGFPIAAGVEVAPDPTPSAAIGYSNQELEDTIK